MDPLDSFAERAREFIAWAEREDLPSSDRDAREVLGILVRLYETALQLPEGEGSDADSEDSPAEQWKGVYARAGNLPVDLYWEIFDPLTEAPDEPVGASLGDDLADIHRDLKRGLRHYEAGETAAAAWEWQFNFRAHWGHHASGAIYALHAWWAEHYFDESGG